MPPWEPVGQSWEAAEDIIEGISAEWDMVLSVVEPLQDSTVVGIWWNPTSRSLDVDVGDMVVRRLSAGDWRIVTSERIR